MQTLDVVAVALLTPASLCSPYETKYLCQIIISGDVKLTYGVYCVLLLDLCVCVCGCQHVSVRHIVYSPFCNVMLRLYCVVANMLILCVWLWFC